MSQSGPALGRFPLTGDPRVTWERLSNLLGSHWDEEQRVEVLGLKYAGSNVYDLRFRAARACRFVRVHVQSDATGGRDYDAATSIESDQVDMRTDRQAEVEITVNGTDDYYVFLVPEFEYEPGSYQRYDGVSGPDHMAYVDILVPASAGGLGPGGLGPATSTDEAVPRFDGTDGDELQDSGVLIDDSDNVTVPGAVDIAGLLTVERATTPMVRVNNTTAGVDLASWDLRVSGAGEFEIRSIQDAGTTIVLAVSVDHATGDLTVGGDLGPASDSAQDIGSPSARWGNGYFDAIDAVTITGDVVGDVTGSVETPDGIIVNPGSDVDADLITVGVTGAPKLWWDESFDGFVLSRPWAVEYPGVSHGIGSFGPNTTDTILKLDRNSADGGASFYAFKGDVAEASVFEVLAIGGTAPTGKAGSVDNYGLINLFAAETSAGAVSAVTANGNVFTISAQRASPQVVFIIDEDGDFHYDGADGGAFDSYDDTALARALSRALSPKDVIRSRWDEFVKYREGDLVAAGVLGDTVANGGLVNGAQVQRLLIGAVWQLQQQINDMRAERSIFGRIRNAIGGIRRLLR